MKTITIKFDSAKIPVELSKSSTDVTNEFGLRNPGGRTNFITLKDNPIKITYKQISNVLHVLTGCRPVPSYRNSFMHRIPAIDDIAKTAYIKFDNSVTYTNKSGETKYCIEFTEGKKLPWNAHTKCKTFEKTQMYGVSGYFTWNSLYKRYGIYRKTEYEELIHKFSEVYGDTIDNIKKKYSLLDFLIELSKEKYNKDELIKCVNNIHCDSIVQVLTNSAEGRDINTINCSPFNINVSNNLAALCINTNPLYKISLSGEICVSIDENDDEKKTALMNMLNGTRCATFLDGGLVYDLRCDNYEFSDYELLNEGFIKIEE